MTVQTRPIRLTLHRVTEEELGDLLALGDEAVEEFIIDRESGADCFLSDSVMVDNYTNELHFLFTGNSWDDDGDSPFERILKGGKQLGSETSPVYLEPEEVEVVGQLLASFSEDDWRKRFKDFAPAAAEIFSEWDEELCQILIEYIVELCEFYLKVSITQDALLKSIEE